MLLRFRMASSKEASVRDTHIRFNGERIYALVTPSTTRFGNSRQIKSMLRTFAINSPDRKTIEGFVKSWRG